MADIDLDDEKTWPPEVTALLIKHFKTLGCYEDERRNIDRWLEANHTGGIGAPQNPHLETYEQTIAQLSNLLTRHSVIGFHCARLTVDDRDSIRFFGLKPLSIESATARIRREEKAGSITGEIADRLIRECRAGDRYRKGMVYLVFNRCLLNETAVERLLRSWGGENLYWAHENDPVIGPALRQIGDPTIVKARIPIGDLKPRHRLCEAMYGGFMRGHGVETSVSGACEGYVTSLVLPAQIDGVLIHPSAGFEQLTNESTWRRRL